VESSRKLHCRPADGNCYLVVTPMQAEHAPLVLVTTIIAAVGATLSLLHAVAQASRGAQGLDTFRSRDLP